MGNIDVKLSARVIAKLILMDEIELDDSWDLSDTQNVLRELYSIKVDEILALVDSKIVAPQLDPERVPQFGKVETIASVPTVFLEKKTLEISFSQLGFELKKDPNSNRSANYKFGENHGKAAAFLGLAVCEGDHVFRSALSYAFSLIHDEETKKNILMKLCFRVPSVQLLLNQAKTQKVNGYDHLSLLSETTQIRRSSSIRTLLKQLRTLNDDGLKSRLDNIVWKKEG